MDCPIFVSLNPTSKELKGVLELDPKGGGQAYTRQAVKKSGIIKVGGSAQLFDSLKRKGVELAEDAANDAFEELKDE